MLKHGAMVAGDERLALRAVYKHGLDVAAAGSVQLRPQREGRAAETDDAAAAQGGEEFVQILGLGRSHGGILLHLAVALYAYRGDAAPRLALILLDGLDGAGNGRVYGNGVPPLLARDELAEINMLAGRDDRLCRLTGMHVHRQQHLFRRCDADGFHAGGRLIMGQLQG